MFIIDKTVKAKKYVTLLDRNRFGLPSLEMDKIAPIKQAKVKGQQVSKAIYGVLNSPERTLG